MYIIYIYNENEAFFHRCHFVHLRSGKRRQRRLIENTRHATLDPDLSGPSFFLGQSHSRLGIKDATLGTDQAVGHPRRLFRIGPTGQVILGLIHN